MKKSLCGCVGFVTFSSLPWVAIRHMRILAFVMRYSIIRIINPYIQDFRITNPKEQGCKHNELLQWHNLFETMLIL